MSQQTGPAAPQVWSRPMVGRRPDEGDRHATFLELFFDLCFVVAVAQAGAGLHHGLSAGHVADAVVGYLMVFFAVWWAWMNFSWFASAYDTDDLAYRLTTLVQIAGALVFAAGVPRAVDARDFGIITLGYVIMRLAMVTQWVRAARSDPVRRRGCLRFAVGIAAVQVGWVARLALPERWDAATFVVLVLAELAVPVWAERQAHTPWHPEHIAERYGLFTLIVLGESVLASTVAVQSALDDRATLGDLLLVAVGGLLTVFAMWWLYFAKDPSRGLTSLRTGFVWGYGHYLVFASAAAVGAGIAVGVDHLTGGPGGPGGPGPGAHLGANAVAASFTVPVAVYVLAVGALQWGAHHLPGVHRVLAPAFAVLVLLATFAPQPVLVTGLLMAVLVTAGLLSARTTPS